MLPVSGAGQDAPMSAAEFEAYVTGRTLTYAQSGETYGIEQYLPGRKVIWAFVGDQCQRGFWYPQGELICFVYDNEPAAQCWRFFRAPRGGLIAQFADGDGQGGEDGLQLYEARNSDSPLSCPGPDVGA
ncbi:MAG: hypothetical protein D6811_09960 [Alphaproteobacteria bacterium]|nr:MAG: hypothetical protein D6811_09960 [Alphaproteobacteria bacterium]